MSKKIGNNTNHDVTKQEVTIKRSTLIQAKELEYFNNINPDFANRILNIFEDESKRKDKELELKDKELNIIEQNNNTGKSNMIKEHTDRRINIILSWLTVMILEAGGLYLFTIGKDYMAIVTMIGAFVPIINQFLKNNKKK